MCWQRPSTQRRKWPHHDAKLIYFLAGGHAFVGADGSRAEGDDIEKAASHDEVLVEGSRQPV